MQALIERFLINQAQDMYDNWLHFAQDTITHCKKQQQEQHNQYKHTGKKSVQTNEQVEGAEETKKEKEDQRHSSTVTVEKNKSDKEHHASEVTFGRNASTPHVIVMGEGGGLVTQREKLHLKKKAIRHDFESVLPPNMRGHGVNLTLTNQQNNGSSDYDAAPYSGSSTGDPHHLMGMGMGMTGIGSESEHDSTRARDEYASVSNGDNTRGLKKPQVSCAVRMQRCCARVCPWCAYAHIGDSAGGSSSTERRGRSPNSVRVQVLLDTQCKRLENILCTVIVLCFALMVFLSVHRYYYDEHASTTKDDIQWNAKTNSNANLNAS